jgi:erythromycin esterase
VPLSIAQANIFSSVVSHYFQKFLKLYNTILTIDMKHAFCFFLLVLAINGFGQNANTDHLKFATAPTLSSFDYARELKDMATSARIIGMGEATHGTAEFEEIKTEIVKTLVLQYHYRHLILEASLAQCQALNEYICSGQGNVELVLTSYVSWPFSTRGFVNMLDWLKDYNKNKSAEDQVKFYGCDIQGSRALNAMRWELNNFHKISGYNDTVLLRQLEEIKGSEKEKQDGYKNLLQQYSSKKYATALDSISAINMIESQICYNISHGGKRYGYRESLLFQYAQYHIQSLSPQEKVIIWAHNGHISKRSSDRKSLGAYLSEAYKDEYKAIGFEFNKGSFRASAIDSSKGKSNLIDFRVGENPQTLGAMLSANNKGILGIDIGVNTHHPLITENQLINDVGAVYSYITAQKENYYTEKIKLKRSFDYLFIVDEMHPTKGLQFKK